MLIICLIGTYHAVVSFIFYHTQFSIYIKDRFWKTILIHSNWNQALLVTHSFLYKTNMANNTFNIQFSEGSRSGHPDKAWLRTVMSKGTASDKMAAFIVTIQDSPVYNLPALRNLVNSVKVSKKNECLSVMGWLWFSFTRVGCKVKEFEIKLS